MNDTVSNVPAPAGRSSPARRRFRLGLPRRREKVVRRGVLASAVAPLASTVGLAIVIFVLASVGSTWWQSYHRDQLFSRAHQPDGSVVSVDAPRQLADETTLMVRGADGAVRQMAVEREAADAHASETLGRLDAERARIKALAREEIDTVLALAFADRDAAIESYADWFFEWKRSYVVLKEAVASTFTRLTQFGDHEPLATAVERDLKQYFMRHYTEQVLKPGKRDPLIASAYEQAARRAHERWRAAIAEEDLRLQLFLAEHTRHLDHRPADDKLTDTALDWDAQRFNAPTYLTEDKAFDGMMSLATIGSGGTLGALVLRPAINRATGRIFAGLGQRYAAAFAGRIAMTQAGAATGTMVQPVGGTVLGALAGGVMGLAADYALNRASEAWNRDAFVAANEEAVEATVSVWGSRLGDGLEGAIDRWFDDSRAAVVASGLGEAP